MSTTRTLRWIVRNVQDGAMLGLTFPLRHISGLLGRAHHVTTIKKAGTVWIRPKSSDGETFVQVFSKKVYDISRYPQFPRVITRYQRILDEGDIPIVVDAGANVGAASILFAKQFPMARVVAIEPDPANAKLCRLNTQGLSNVTVIEAAIGSERGRVSLSNPAEQSWAIRTTRKEDGEIAVCTISDLAQNIKNARLFAVKVDIEGFEEDLFAKNTQWLDEAEVVIIEPHDWLFSGRGTSRNFQRAISTRGFEILVSGDNLIYIRL
jgi:FkbM family methyltransferase